MFKEKFKYYKRKCPPPDYGSVLDFISENNTKLFRQVYPLEVNLECDFSTLGLVPVDLWKIYEIVHHPGLFVIKNPFTSNGQRYWIRKCLEEYTRSPNKNNLLPHGQLSSEEDWWTLCISDVDRRNNIYKQMRWVTLGYHHNWDTKIYSEGMKDDFPPELNKLCQVFGLCIGGWQVEAQAAIVNYYHMECTLSGHTDHSEPNCHAPLFSLSFGQSAIFLIGGPHIEDYATGILVESGDCIIMSGTSRLSYHGVPKVLEAKEKPWLADGPVPKVWNAFADYVSESRINLNVRQVLFPGQKHLP